MERMAIAWASMNSKNTIDPETERARETALRPGRYAIGTLLVSSWIMIGALHIPVDALLSGAQETLFAPSFDFFMPLTLLYIALLPRVDNVLAISDLLAMCAADIGVGAIVCLPLLFPRGVKQNRTAVISLILVVGYTLWAAVHYVNRYH